MPKVTLIGAGGIGWTRTFVRDIVAVPELCDTTFALTDIDAERLGIVERVIRSDLAAHGLPAQVTATTDRREALRDADYVINAVRVGGLDMWRTDIEIPLKYGVDQCIGDTLGPGGIMYGQRTVPVVLEFCRDVRELAKPGVWFLNYVNPMSIITWAALDYGGVNVLGLCHGVQHGSRMIAQVLGMDLKDMDFRAAGVNHMTWFTRLLHKGEDVTGRLLAEAERFESKFPAEKVRVDLLRRTGFFPTESSGFASELTPWYRKRQEDLAQWAVPGYSHHGGETAGGWRFNVEKERWFRHLAEELDRELDKPIELNVRTYEHASYIIEAMETGRVYKGCFNVRNEDCIVNLPPDAVVETPCFVDREGVHVPRFGGLPDICAGICSAMISAQRPAVKAAATGNIRLLKQAMMLDPLTAAVCTTKQISQMTDELLVAEAQHLPQFKDAIPDAERRLQEEEPLGTGDIWPTTRQRPREIAEMDGADDGMRELILSIFTGQQVRSQ